MKLLYTLTSASLLFIYGGTYSDNADTVKLVHDLTQNREMDYQVSMVFRAGNTDVAMLADTHEQVVDFKNGLLTIERAMKNCRIKAGDQEQKLDDTVITKLQMDAQGAVTNFLISRSSNDLRTAKITQITFPKGELKVGEEWVNSEKSTATKNFRAMQSKYKLVKLTTSGNHTLAVISVDAKETEGKNPMTCKGEATVDSLTGVLQKSQFVITNFPLDGGAPLTVEYSCQVRG